MAEGAKKIAVNLLRFIREAPADKAFYEAGMACKATGDLNMAFVFLNRYLDITEATYEALGLPGFGPEIKGSCQNHGGQGLGAVSQWDAAADQFVLITDYIESNQDVIQPLIAEDSQAYADETGITPNCD